jgi:hypothetical protein
MQEMELVEFSKPCRGVLKAKAKRVVYVVSDLI